MKAFKHILSVDQFTTNDLRKLFSEASTLKQGIERGHVYSDLNGKILTALFYEPSSRTFASHMAAMQRLGGKVIPIQGVTYSSVSKGETLEDTIRTFASYSDVIALRHPENGAARRAAEVSDIPIINAGDGTGEHPTQALLDLYTINDRLKRTSKLSVALVGDLKFGRTVHSLAKLLSLHKDITLYFVCPESSPMPDSIVKLLKKRNVTLHTASSIEDIIGDIDALYMTRVQKERMDAKLYNSIKDLFILNNTLANKMKKDAIIMHPLPRVHEITKDVDANPRAVYFTDQMKNGMYIRMALLKMILV